MQITILGSGTSTGVPQIGCSCPTCSSQDPLDKRLRCSALVTADNGSNILIDCGPDFRQQIIDAGAPPLEALLITHSHYDHVGGIDDLRPYCTHNRHFPTYCQADVAKDLKERNPWSFATHLYPGVPTFEIRQVTPYIPFRIASMDILPLTVMHGNKSILAFRINDLGYVTDCKTMPDKTLEALKGVHTLIINALRPKPHRTHLSLDEALDIAGQIGAKQTILTHISHDMPPHAQVALPPSVRLAHDKMVLQVD